jgi:hypothetical protein
VGFWGSSGANHRKHTEKAIPNNLQLKSKYTKRTIVGPEVLDSNGCGLTGGRPSY